MEKFKKLLALVMALCMMITMAPTSAFASEITELQEDTEEDTNAGIMPLSSGEENIATTSLTLGTKPADSTVSGEPFDTSVSKNYRIPGIVTLDDGTIVASADARWDYEKDGGGMDLVISRSTDSGATWNYTFAGYLGDNGNVWNADSSTLMDPLLMTDGKTLYLFADMFPAGYSISSSSTTNTFSDTATGFDGNGNLLLSNDNRSSYGYYLKSGKIYSTDGTEVSGYTVDGWFNLYQGEAYVTNLFFSDSPYQVHPTSYICMMSSTDGGATWSDPELLNVKPSGVSWMVLGPGQGIIASDGTMMFSAYDGSKVYIVFSKDEGNTWTWISTNAASNESQLVELNDGTIRMFVKSAGTNTIQYIDFTKDGDSYSVSDLTNTGVANFSQCMVSAIKYSRTINGKEAVFVCCPSDSSGGCWAGRFNGKIYVFTLDDSNAMTLAGSYQINDSFFAYSNMTECADGSIDLLYEDDCISYTAGSYDGIASHITYKNLPITTIISDAEIGTGVEKKTVTDDETGISVTAPDLSKVIINKQTSSTPANGYNRSVTYSIELYDSNEKLYQGSATVKVPVDSTFNGCLKYTGSVDGDEFEVSNPEDGYFTLNVPHFSDVTISGYALDATTVDITLYERESKTVTIDGAAYSDKDVTTDPDTSKATISSITGTSSVGGSELVAVTAIESGKQYLIVNTKTGEVLTDTAVTVSGDWDDKAGLETTGTASVDSTELWTITGADGSYTVVQDSRYLQVAGFVAYASETETALTLNYTANGWTIYDSTTGKTLGHDAAGYYLSDNVGNNYTAGALGTSNTDNEYLYWNLYEIVTNEASSSTDVTFTGIAVGTTTATIGHVTYNITVKDVTSGDISDFNSIVGVDEYSDDNSNTTYRSDLDMAGKKITSLTISAGATFHLGVDVSEYDSVEWSVADSSVATVDQNGNVTGVSEGETTVTATVIKDGVEESITIPVKVYASLVTDGAESVSIFYYIEEIDNTTPYYTMYLSSYSTEEPVYKMVAVTEGEVIYLLRPTNTAYAWVWTATPDKDHALTLMTSTGSISEYYPLKDNTGALGKGTVDGTEYYIDNNAYNNVVSVGTDAGASWQNNLDTLLANSISSDKCDGAMSNTRWDHDGVPKVVTSMTFISEPLLQIDKSVYGILPTSRKQADFRTYYDGMVASVSEYVYFKVTVTLERPTVWSDEDETINAITYTDAILSDTVLDGAYFYTKELDNLDGAWDGKIAEKNRVQKQKITDELNAAWAKDENTRTIEYYVIYEIKEEDIPKFYIDNTAELDYEYKSKYSKGSLIGSADAEATITVVGLTMDNVVIDFGQSVTITGLSNEHLKYVSFGDNVNYVAKYGTVEITAEQRTDSNGNLMVDDYNYPVYDYTVTYTPTAILQEPDVVQLKGTYYDEKLKDYVTKVINGFVVYPATTVHYEEGFLFGDTSENWDVTNVKKATMNQAFELLGESVYDTDGTLTKHISDQKYDYGYDQIYDSSDTYSGNSYATTSKMGASTSFNITGTGLEVFAGCTEETGYVSVMIQNSAGRTVKFYMVNTVALNGTTTATENQNVDFYGRPIVSVDGLAHDTYTITLTKIMESDKPVYIDGIRVFNTVADSSIYAVDEEDNPEYYQLRDVVLKALNVEGVSDSAYGSISEMAKQVYAGITNDSEQPAAILYDSAYEGTIDVQDLLDNGPKNELFLRAEQTLVFRVTTDRLMQLGLSAPAGATSYTVTTNYTDVNNNVQKLGGTEQTMNSSVDMFYSLGNPNGTEHTYTVTITNNGSNILSVTDLKICDDPNVSFETLTETDIKYALTAMGYGPGFADATLEISLVDADGNKVAGTVLTSTGIAGETATFAASVIEETAASILPAGYNLTDAAYKAMEVVCGKDISIILGVEEKEGIPDKPAVTFKDIKEGSFYYDSVYWAVRKDITQGIGDSLFNPEGTCTRAQVVTFLWRAAGEPKPETTKNPFVDVEEGAYYYDAVLWAYENGITLGLDEEHFDPEGACTRAQVVTFLWRVAEKPKAETAKNPFEDVKKGDYYYDAVLWAYKNGITNGISDTQFQIDGTCKRAQAVTFLYRMYE